MGRPGKIWWRAERNEWFATINSKKTPLGPDHKAAEREFHRLKAEQTHAEVDTLAVWVLVERYLDWASTRVKPISHKTYAATLQTWIDTWGNLLATELRPYHVTRWLAQNERREVWFKDKKDTRRKKWVGWGRSTQSLHTLIVKIWSAWCQREGYLDVDRLRTVKSGGIARRSPAPSAWITRLFDVVENEPVNDFLLVLWETGCRPGEIRTLEASRCDWRASTAHVIGKRGQRMIGLASRARDVLRRNATKYPSGPVLRNEQGEPWSVHQLKRRLDRLCVKAGVGHITPYHFRHDLWSRWTKAGIDSVLIARQLGHVNLTQLVSRYAHPDAAQLASAAEAASTFDSSSKPHHPESADTAPPTHKHQKE